MAVSELFAVILTSLSIAGGGVLLARGRQSNKSYSDFLEMEAKAARLLTHVTEALSTYQQRGVESNEVRLSDTKCFRGRD